ncbi:hypothetical protein [Acinetobacter bereziniae]|uniref:hypothetical protein n=1 Tax=Acinetobacter bereziniae TaxID=106648 RepID=UPI0021E4023E|nr:hypothetical protein [Acinetobacter bereziniae]MCV2444762.1 hypothetical protein [Acinetobacter bereziniae]
MKKYLLIIFIMASNSCIAYTDTPNARSDCERISIQAKKIMERRQAGVTFETEKQSLQKFLEIYPKSSEDSKSRFVIFFNKLLSEAHSENIKETNFQKEITINGFKQKILNNCLNGDLFDGLI